MMKVARKSQIVPTLLAGGYVKYEIIEAKPILFDADNKIVGTLHFDTYLQLDLREIEMKIPFGQPNAIPMYRVKRIDAWQGYDTFKLKPEFIELYNKVDDDMKKILIKKIWR